MSTKLHCKYWKRTKCACLSNCFGNVSQQEKVVHWMANNLFWSVVSIWVPQVGTEHAVLYLLNCQNACLKRQVNLQNISYSLGNQLGRLLQKLGGRSIFLWPQMMTVTLPSFLWPRISKEHMVLPKEQWISAGTAMPSHSSCPSWVLVTWRPCGGPHCLLWGSRWTWGPLRKGTALSHTRWLSVSGHEALPSTTSQHLEATVSCQGVCLQPHLNHRWEPHPSFTSSV